MDETTNHVSESDKDGILRRWQADPGAIEAARLEAARRVLSRRPILKGLLAGASLLAFGGQDLSKILLEGGPSPAFAQAVTTTLFATTTAPFVTTTLFRTTTAPFVTTTLFRTTTAPFVTTTLFRTTTAPFVTTTLFSTTTDYFPPPPSPDETPELDSLLLFGSGAAAMASYGLRRWRGTRQPPPTPNENQQD
jgi:hypothetical protein